MKHFLSLFAFVLVLLICSASLNSFIIKSDYMSNPLDHQEPEQLKMGAFSQSLSVKDLEVSKTFYEHLGFKVLAGSKEVNYYILKNGNALIGIFHGMFEGNIMTFNPGWDESGQNTETFDDVRHIQKHLKQNDIAFESEADETTSGPASFMIKDPDGNMILVDQHR